MSDETTPQTPESEPATNAGESVPIKTTPPEGETAAAGVEHDAAEKAGPEPTEAQTPQRPKIKPTIGRVVLYTPPRSGPGEVKTYPAIITHVWGDDCVNLNVLNDGSYPLQNTTPTSVSRSEVVGFAGTWAWMPYQQGQAAKTDDIAKRLEAAFRALISDSCCISADPGHLARVLALLNCT